MQYPTENDDFKHILELTFFKTTENEVRDYHWICLSEPDCCFPISSLNDTVKERTSTDIKSPQQSTPCLLTALSFAVHLCLPLKM